MPADILGWAIAGKLEIVASFPPITAGGHDRCGMMAIPPECVVAMFRRDGTGPSSKKVYRVRSCEASEEWQRIQHPPDGVEIHAADLMITAAQVERFEDEHSLTKRVAPGGRAPRWDWDAFYTALIRRIHNHGVPETQREMVMEMVDWFERRSDNGDAPDERTIARKISEVWRELREA